MKVSLDKKHTKAQLLASAQRLLDINAQCKALYAERDQCESILLRACGDDGRIELPAMTVEVQDNFRDRDGNPRNVAFKTAAVKRFDLKILPAAKT